MGSCKVYLFILASASLSAVTGERWLWESEGLLAAESRQGEFGIGGSSGFGGLVPPPPPPGLAPPVRPPGPFPRPSLRARELGFRAIRNRPSSFPRFNRQFGQFGKPLRARPAPASRLQPPQQQPATLQPTDGPIPIVIRPLELDISKLPLENSAHELAPHQLHPPFPSATEVFLATRQLDAGLQGVDLDGQSSILNPTSFQTSRFTRPIDAQLIKAPHPDALISVPDISVLPLVQTSNPAPDISQLPLQGPGEENSFPFQHALLPHDESFDTARVFETADISTNFS